jgi:hypothetical protein
VDELVVTHEVGVVHLVEADQRGEHADVGLGERVADEVAPIAEVVVPAVERAEQVVDRLVVRRLRGGEAGAVDAVVDRLVDLGYHLVHVRDGRLVVGTGQQRDAVAEVVERGREGAQDLAGLVVDDGLLRGVPQHGDGHAAGGVGVGRDVQLAEVVAVAEVIRRTARLLGGELPAALAAVRVHDRDADRVLQPEQRPREEDAVRPRARVGDVQVVPASLRLKALVRLGVDVVGHVAPGDPVPEGGLAALERAVVVRRLVRVRPPLAVDELVHTGRTRSTPITWAGTCVSPGGRAGAARAARRHR